MTCSVYLFAPTAAAAPWRWVARRTDDSWLTGETLDAFEAETGIAPAAAATTTLVMAGENAVAAELDVPTRARRQIERAVPFLVEEYLAEDVEDLHLAIGDRSAQGRVPVRALRRALLADRMAEATEVGFAVGLACLDHDVLAAPDADLELWVGADRALLRTASCALATELEVLPSLLSDLETQRALFRVDAEAEDPSRARFVAELETLLAGQPEITVEAFPEPGDLDLQVARALDAGARTIDLLTGAFRPARPRSSGANGLRLAAGVLLAWFTLQSALDIGRTAWLEGRTEALRAENLELFTEVLPGRSRSPDPRRELERMVAGGGGDSASFMDLLGVVAAELGGIGGNPELRGMNWNAQRGDLALDLGVPSIDQVDALKAALEGEGYAVSIDSAVQEQSRVRARVRVRHQEQVRG